jgi:hypothetical protein
MAEPLTSQQAAERILSFLHDGRLVQGAWHAQIGGRDLACMIGAIDPSINDASQCPSSVMPQWLAHCTVTLFDGQSKSDAMAWAERYAGLMQRWRVLTPDAWARTETRFKIECVKFAIAAAEPACKDKDYWPQVKAAAQQVIDALEGRGDLAAARAAAYAAADAAARAAARAARAADAAARAAAYAADAAADAAAYAADAAARAAARAAAYAAAYAADAADAAADAAARAAIASKLLDAIELEVVAAESLTEAR